MIPFVKMLFLRPELFILTFLPSTVLHVIILDSHEICTSPLTEVVFDTQICSSAKVYGVKIDNDSESSDDIEVMGNTDACDDVKILSIATPTLHMNILQQLNYRKHS